LHIKSDKELFSWLARIGLFYNGLQRLMVCGVAAKGDFLGSAAIYVKWTRPGL